MRRLSYGQPQPWNEPTSSSTERFQTVQAPPSPWGSRQSLVRSLSYRPAVCHPFILTTVHQLFSVLNNFNPNLWRDRFQQSPKLRDSAPLRLDGLMAKTSLSCGKARAQGPTLMLLGRPVPWLARSRRQSLAQHNPTQHAFETEISVNPPEAKRVSS